MDSKLRAFQLPGLRVCPTNFTQRNDGEKKLPKYNYMCCSVNCCVSLRFLFSYLTQLTMIRGNNAGALVFCRLPLSPPEKQRVARDDTKSAHLRKLSPKVDQLAPATCPVVFVRSAVFSHKGAAVQSIPRKSPRTVPGGEMLLNNESSGCSKPPPFNLIVCASSRGATRDGGAFRSHTTK